MGGSLTLFSIRGIPVRVHVSWLVIYGLIAWSLAIGYFPRTLPDMPLLALWATGLLAALLLFVSVFLYELSHALVALRGGIGVSALETGLAKVRSLGAMAERFESGGIPCLDHLLWRRVRGAGGPPRM